MRKILVFTGFLIFITCNLQSQSIINGAENNSSKILRDSISMLVDSVSNLSDALDQALTLHGKSEKKMSKVLRKWYKREYWAWVRGYHLMYAHFKVYCEINKKGRITNYNLKGTASDNNCISVELTKKAGDDFFSFYLRRKYHKSLRGRKMMFYMGWLISC